MSNFIFLARKSHYQMEFKKCWQFFLLSVLLHEFFVVGQSQRPHIIFMLSDDMGWNDVSYHGMNEIYTPNIDTLAAAGVLLNNYYTLPVCTPSRAAFLTGLYPTKTGLQHYVIPDAVPGGLPVDIKTLPQYLKELGYITRMVGKWHLGFNLRAYTPTMRGFDSHYGYWSGLIDYFQYTSSDQGYGSIFRGSPARLQNKTVFFNGKDIWDDFNPVRGTRGQYATDLFTDRAVNIINSHNPSVPLFLYFPQLAVHRGNPNLPVVAPDSYTRPYSYILNSTRRNFAGALTALDQSLGRVMQALLQRGMLTNCILAFVSDNGAQQTSDYLTGGSNFPLRGQKNTNFEGGIRVPSIVWGSTLPVGITDGMMHMVDWLPTLYDAAGGNSQNLTQVDGVNQWPMISTSAPSARTNFLINYDTDYDTGGYRDGDYKLVVGNYTYAGNANSQWRNDPGRISNPRPRPTTSQVLQVLRQLYGNPNLNYQLNLPQVNCGGNPPTNVDGNQCFTTPYCLFNITADPCEYRNIAANNPQIVQRLNEEMLTAASNRYVPPLSDIRDYAANPLDHCGYWDNWSDTQQSATFCRRG